MSGVTPKPKPNKKKKRGKDTKNTLVGMVRNWRERVSAQTHILPSLCGRTRFPSDILLALGAFCP